MPRTRWHEPPNPEEILSRFFLPSRIHRPSLSNDFQSEDPPLYGDNGEEWTIPYPDSPLPELEDDYVISKMDEKCFESEEKFFWSLCESFVASGFKKREKEIPEKIKPDRYVSVFQQKKLERKEKMFDDLFSSRKPNSGNTSFAADTPAHIIPQCSGNSALSQSNDQDLKRALEVSERAYEREIQVAILSSSSQRHDSGLSFAQLMDLCNRDLTPEDYEMLLRLDETVAKKTVEEEKMENLEETVIQEPTTECCSVCMCPYEPGEKVKNLPCGHFFHVDCIVPWLKNHAQTCPLCKSNVNL